MIGSLRKIFILGILKVITKTPDNFYYATLRQTRVITFLFEKPRITALVNK